MEVLSDKTRIRGAEERSVIDTSKPIRVWRRERGELMKHEIHLLPSPLTNFSGHERLYGNRLDPMRRFVNLESTNTKRLWAKGTVVS